MNVVDQLNEMYELINCLNGLTSYLSLHISLYITLGPGDSILQSFK